MSNAVELPNDLLENMRQIGVLTGGSLKALFYPQSGPFAREGYAKHMEFFRACGSGLYKVLSIFGGNRTGKTFAPCYAIACWMTGEYPDWWDEVGGLRFEKPIRVLCAGQTGVLVRNSIQKYLFGTKERPDTGLVPESSQRAHAWQNKPQGLLEKIAVAGRYGMSTLEFKSYDAARVRFQSDMFDVVLLDEEPDAGIFSEAVTRTGTTRGIVICAFTALKGITPLVSLLLPQFSGQNELNELAKIEAARWHCFVGWDDIPQAQLSYQERARMKAHYLPHEIVARTTGIPSIGSGMVWPMAETDLLVPSFTIPEDWPQFVTLDPGFEHGTGALRLALDQEADSLYITADHWKRLEHYAVHVDRIQTWGTWLPVVMDYASGTNIEDGEAVKSKYKKALETGPGRNPVFNANKSWHLGATAVYDRMTSGRLFVFETCRTWLSQYRQYVRNEKGKIAMPNDPNDATRHHFELMDCTRYGALGVQHAKVMPAEARETKSRYQQLPADKGGPIETIDVVGRIFG